MPLAGATRPQFKGVPDSTSATLFSMPVQFGRNCGWRAEASTSRRSLGTSLGACGVMQQSRVGVVIDCDRSTATSGVLPRPCWPGFSRPFRCCDLVR
jgi:hypothetical protein